MVLTLRLLLHFPLRQVEGFVSSFLQLMGINIPTPVPYHLIKTSEESLTYESNEDRPTNRFTSSWTVRVYRSMLKVLVKGEEEKKTPEKASYYGG